MPSSSSCGSDCGVDRSRSSQPRLRCFPGCQHNEASPPLVPRTLAYAAVWKGDALKRCQSCGSDGSKHPPVRPWTTPCCVVLLCMHMVYVTFSMYVHALMIR